MKFLNKIFVLGCGGVSQSTIPLIIKHLQISPHQITVLDFQDNSSKIPEGVKYYIEKLTSSNYQIILEKYLKKGDLLLDLSWNVSTLDLLIWCKSHGVMYVNTSVEVWNPFKDHSSEESTLYKRHMDMRKAIHSWKGEKTATAVLDHGANPGLISSFVKQGIIDIATEIATSLPNGTRKEAIRNALHQLDFPKLAYLIGLKTIHVSELDTQSTTSEKKEGEFVNTWSAMGLYEEGIAPSEIGWGTHELSIPKGARKNSTGPQNTIYLDTSGIDTIVDSWVPSGPIKGMVIRHGEAFSLSEYLTYRDDSKNLYRPTVHYAYHPCNETLKSLDELRATNLKIPKHYRILRDEISSGRDELGCLLLGHDLGAWWTGSILDIKEARTLVPHQNATTVQVAIGIVAAVIYCVRHPLEGICLPEHLPHDFVLKIAEPYLGEFISIRSDWRPQKQGDDRNNWQFEVFQTETHELPIGK